MFILYISKAYIYTRKELAQLDQICILRAWCPHHAQSLVWSHGMEATSDWITQKESSSHPEDLSIVKTKAS